MANPLLMTRHEGNHGYDRETVRAEKAGESFAARLGPLGMVSSLVGIDSAESHAQPGELNPARCAENNYFIVTDPADAFLGIAHLQPIIF